MNRQQAAVARLNASRGRLRLALVGGSGTSGVQALLGALVRDHPLSAAALALLLGGLVVRLRPWRWLLRPELWAALLPQLIGTLSQASLGTWAEVLAALLRRAEPAEPVAAAAADGVRPPAPSPAPAPVAP